MNADVYSAWAPSYPPYAHNQLMVVEQHAVLELLPPVRGLTVLDAGCGTGRYARLLAERGASDVLCVDLSPAMLHRLPRGTRSVRADLRALPIASESVDVMVCGLALPDIPEIASFLSESCRILKQRGVIVCSTLHPRGAELGWTRTFETAEGKHELPAYWHSLNDLHTAFSAAGFAVDAFLEPSLTLSHSRMPAALVLRAHRC
jgi:malonyl-CoA O-methyltransferase